MDRWDLVSTEHLPVNGTLFQAYLGQMIRDSRLLLIDSLALFLPLTRIGIGFAECKGPLQVLIAMKKDGKVRSLAEVVREANKLKEEGNE